MTALQPLLPFRRDFLLRDFFIYGSLAFFHALSKSDR